MASANDPPHAAASDSPAGPDDPASRAIALALSMAVARLGEACEQALSGSPTGIRRLRATSRRLRSQLRAFRDFIDPEWSGRLLPELRWLGSTLGGPRDLDVLRERFGRGESAEERESLKPLFDGLARRRTKARAAVRRTLRGRRFGKLVAELDRSAREPRLTDRANKPSRKVLPPLVRRAWRKFGRGAERLAVDSPDAALHEVRNLAKRARYVTELIAPILGPKARRRGARLVDLARNVQDVLGAHQDSVVAALEVEAVIVRGDGDDAFRDAAATLLAGLRRDADEARFLFLKEWRPRLGKRRNRGRL